ncbi:hypothetical protein GCK32_010443, partial [Trichostrongylus colubriformis]
VPDRRSVADLRRQITSRLEMKAPDSSSRGPSRAEATGSPVPSRHFPHNFIKVHEGAEPENRKPYLGRVLDGPPVLSPDKFYQGVMPPSLLQCHSPVPGPVATPDTKPPSPLPKTAAKYAKRNAFINRLARESSPVENHDHTQDERPRQEEQPERPTTAMPSEVRNQLPEENEASREKSFDTVFQTAAAFPEKDDRPADEEVKSPVNPVKQEGQWNGSAQSRMSDLLKSRSPAPFSYSASPNPEILSSAAVQDLTSSLTEVLASFSKTPPASNVTSDSGYDGEGTLQQTPRDRTPKADQSFGDHKFDMDMSTSGNWQETSSAAKMDSDSRRPTSQEEAVLRGSEPPASSSAIEAGGEPTMYDKFLAGPSNHTPEMSLWYRNMFKKMHKIESPADSSILRHRIREESPAPTISRPLTPLTFTALPPSRHECEVTPRRAKSVGRIIEPEILANSRHNSANLFALEKSRTTHFHLPSYKFVHEDARPIVSDCRPGAQDSSRCGIRCLRCGLRRKDPSWTEIDAIVNSLSPGHDRSLDTQRHIQSRVALRCITENLDDTAHELSQFIQRLEQFWNRSRSSPQLSVCGEGGSSSTTAEDIAELKRISKEELLYRQKAERLAEELQEQRNRRHGYVPTASPSLVNNKERFGGLLDEYSRRSTPPHQQPVAVRTATAIFKFDAKTPRELSLNRGEVIRIRREVDANWLEGERNGACGLFPRSYVQLDDEFDRSRSKAKAVYPFTARRPTELSLKMVSFSIHDLHSSLTSFISSTIQSSEPTSFSHDSGFIDNRLSQTSSSVRQAVPAETSCNRIMENAKQEGYLCTADKIPRGSQTYRALYPFTPTKEDEVALEVNDIIFVVEKCDDGWFIGTVLRTGQFGTFPGNYVERH